MLMIGLATNGASAQTAITPSTTTLQIAGSPDPQSPITAPDGGIIMYGSAISPATNQPVRHLWVADGSAGICRIDPDLDSPGPFAINPETCAFQVNGSRITGAGMAFDPTTNLLYFADQKQGIFQIVYVGAADNGNGLLDYTTLFGMGGNPAGTIYPGGQTGCPLPGTPNQPSSVALDPQGNLWVGSKSATLLRFNNPDAAGTSFGSCATFIQAVATTPNNKVVTGLAWIGHDLWGASFGSPFVIRNADIACLVPPNPSCTPGNGTVTSMLSSVGGATSLGSDQVYPNINGDNLYFGLGANIAWLANAGAAASDQGLTLTYVDPSTTLANVGAVVVDATDPANLVVYAGDDPSALGTAGAGRWMQTTQSATPGAPGAPVHVVADADDSQATVSWSPRQAAQKVTSYTIHNNFASNGFTVNDIVIVPTGPNPHPATSATATGLTNGISYQFQVTATNAQGTGPASASNFVTPPGLEAPGTPGGAQAIPGDAQAYVSWFPPINAAVVPITSYTVTALQNGASTGLTGTAIPPATNAVVSGLTNGKPYTFVVHANNDVGKSTDSSQSNAVTPLASILPIMKVEVNGPGSVTSVPAQVTYQVVVTNTSLFPVTNILVNDVLSTTDTAYIISGQPSQGFCTPGGNDVTNIVCSLGTMAGQQIVTINVTAQMQGAQIADTARVTGSDANGDSLTFKVEHRATAPPSSGSPITSSLPSVQVPVTATATPTSLHPGDSGLLIFTASNTSSTPANDFVFFITVDIGLTVNNVNVTTTGGSTPATCNEIAPGLIGTNLITCTIPTLGGPAVNGVAPAQKITVQLTVTAPNRSGLTFLPTGSVDFFGNDSAQATAFVQLKVH